MTMFGRYRLEASLGRGGMGEVFRAFDTERERMVAVKRLRPDLDNGREFAERFRRESRIVARLKSPHVIPIHDFGEIDGQLFLDMRLVEGRNLAAAIADGPFEPLRAVEIVRQVAEALDAAHADGLVHRDVKPSNVLLSTSHGRDFVYLVDFGIARSVRDDAVPPLTATGETIGTLAYMAPELFTRASFDRRVDVYALACMFYEMVTGRPPFAAEGPALIYQHMNEPPPRTSTSGSGLSPRVDDVIARGMAKDPSDRYATSIDFAEAAEAAVALTAPGLPSGGTPTRTAHGPYQLVVDSVSGVDTPVVRSTRWPLVIAGGIVATVALVATLIFAAGAGAPEPIAEGAQGVAAGASTPTSPTPAAKAADIEMAFPEIRKSGSRCETLPAGSEDGNRVQTSEQVPDAEVRCTVRDGAASVYFMQWAGPNDARAFYEQAISAETRAPDTDTSWTLGDKRQGDIFYADANPFIIAVYQDRRYLFYVVGDDKQVVGETYYDIAVADIDELPS